MLSDILRQVFDTPERKCVVGQWVDEQNTEDQELLQQVFNSQRLVMSKLHAKLKESGDITFGVTIFKSHIKGTCTCPKI
jgi:hypothetical protein